MYCDSTIIREGDRVSTTRITNIKGKNGQTDLIPKDGTLGMCHPEILVGQAVFKLWIKTVKKMLCYFVMLFLSSLNNINPLNPGQFTRRV